MKDPPTAAELDRVLDALGMEPRDLIRRREKEYKELGLADADLTRENLIAAMVEHPRLIERPVGLSGERAALGRPAERLLDLV